MNREETLLVAANLFEKANKIEQSINWNNDAERDSALNQIGKLILDANWQFVSAYKKGV